MEPLIEVWASVPATIANLNVGFDALGLALTTPRERMRARRLPTREVRILLSEGAELPTRPEENVAGVAALSALELGQADFGVELLIDKRVKPGSGLGSSASSAVAAALAVSALLERPLSRREILRCALDGEALVSGARHADNVAPALFGGLCLNTPDGVITPLPTPPWHLVAHHPQYTLRTAEARAALPSHVPLGTTSAAAAWMGLFVSACYRGEWEEAAVALQDLYVGPARAHLIPAFEVCRKTALGAGALSGGISGSGPSTFWICLDEETAINVQDALLEACAQEGVKAQSYLAQVDAQGAFIEAG